ncbi:hypothetical protein KHDHEBDM_02449 [Pectobacterium polaris]|nr:hypothetical protein KHDHEBDM_02449 [Pectobacterium polaris]
MKSFSIILSKPIEAQISLLSNLKIKNFHVDWLLQMFYVRFRSIQFVRFNRVLSVKTVSSSLS